MAEAILLARSGIPDFAESIAVADARVLLQQLAVLDPKLLPQQLIAEPVREATAAGAGAILKTPEHKRETYLVIDVGAGTTVCRVFICVNNPESGSTPTV